MTENQQEHPCNLIEVRQLQKVQSFGAIVAVDKESLVITHVSENISNAIGVGPDDLLGKKFNEIKDNEHIVKLAEAIAQNKDRLLIFQEPLESQGSHEILLHENKDHFIVEWIFIDEEENKNTHPKLLFSHLVSLFSSYQNEPDLVSFSKLFVKRVEELFDFDRVLLLKFLDDQSGDVIAEQKKDFMDSYLGQRFPAPDVPPQARETYKEQPLRMIINAHENEVPVRSNSEDASIDMTRLWSKGVADIHQKYIKNMGISTSISYGITGKKGLWGMICFHHKEPKKLSYLTRSFLHLLSNSLKSAIHYFAEKEVREKIEMRENFFQAFAEQLNQENTNYLEVIGKFEEQIRNIFEVTGFCLHVFGKSVSYGNCPSGDRIQQIAGWVKDQPKNNFVYSTQNLSQALPEAKDLQEHYSGLLAIQISANPEDLILLFRPESISTIKWAGDPKKHFEQTDKEGLAPRSSFARYEEQVRSLSAAWKLSELTSADEFGGRLRSNLLRSLYLEKKMSEVEIFQITAAANIVDGGILILAEDLKIIWANNWIYQFFKVNQDLNGKPFIDFLKEHEVETQFLEKNPIQFGQEWFQEVSIGKNPENSKTCFVKLISKEVENSHEKRFAGLITDVTKIKKSEAQLAELNKQKDEFIKMASHDLRNPLNIILSSAAVLPEKKDNAEESAKLIDIIMKQGDSLVDILNQLLNTVGATSGKIAIHREKIRFGEFLEENFRFNEILAQKKKIKLNKEFAVEREEGAIDKNKVKQVIDNLVSNAVKYSNPETEVLLKAHVFNDRLEITVQDHGLGIPQEEHSKVFQANQKLSPKPTGGETSNGLGLSNCKKIVEAMQGQISFQSQPGQGSSFTFSVPIKDEGAPAQNNLGQPPAQGQNVPQPPAQPQEGNQPPAPQQSPAQPQDAAFDMSKAKPLKKLLIVDDDPNLITLAKEAFKKIEGLEMETALNKDETLQKANDFQPEVILLDQNLGGIAGTAIHDELKKNDKTKNIAIIYVTGQTDPEFKKQVEQLGAIGIIEKPFRYHEFPIQLMKLWSQKK